jgi:hypothetical protein
MNLFPSTLKAASAAWSAESAAWSGAGYAAYKRYAAELIRLLENEVK